MKKESSNILLSLFHARKNMKEKLKREKGEIIMIFLLSRELSKFIVNMSPLNEEQSFQVILEIN